jgi:cell wall-associated NlpC family hydrolase
MRWLLSSSITLSLATGTIAVIEEPIVANDTAISIVMLEAVERPPLFLSDEYIAQMLADEKAKKEQIIADVAEAKNRADAYKNTVAMEERIRLLEKQIDKTWYVFSGSTPQGWDCSGMVKWFYQGLGVELWHGASAQKNSGVRVDVPKRGDIVSFGFGGDTAGHVGLYIAPDVMLHAGGKRGQKTSYRSISEFNKQYGELEYTRILETK